MFKKERGTRANEQIQQALLEIGSICTSLVVFYNDNNKTLKQPWIEGDKYDVEWNTKTNNIGNVCVCVC